MSHQGTGFGVRGKAGALPVSVCALALIALMGCGGGSPAADEGGGGGGGGPPAAPQPARNTYDVDALGIPKFVSSDYIDLAPIYRVSKFRSGTGHDYSDDFESCRSMKHYYQPQTPSDWSAVRIYAPVTGTVESLLPEWAGTQVRIQSQAYPAFVFILFHVNPSPSLAVGDSLVAGQQIGTHIGSQTSSDIAVRVATPTGSKLVSYMSVMTDALFANYQLRGVSTRDDLIVTRAARDADSLQCTGEAFGTFGTLENWLVLN